MKIVTASLSAVLSFACWLGCSTDPITPAIEAPATIETTSTTKRMYPTVEQLYGGEQGIYRGCGPNNGVCHNSREFPNFSTIGGLVENLGLPCNQKREDPTQVHDLCERSGDFLRVAGAAAIEIANISAAETRTWKMVLREPLPGGIGASGSLDIVRAGPPKEIVLVALNDIGAKVTVDPSDGSGRTLVVNVPVPVSQEAGEEAEDDLFAPLFEKAGLPGEPASIRVGDPNRNGTFGASLGGAIIVPGHPEKSYLFTRLTDPSAGPMMPRANCCFWTKASVRALWCWVAGLAPDGKNAFDPIDYDACPAGPTDTMLYPDPGKSCETSGMCPVKPKAMASTAPTFDNVYESVLKHSCDGSSCHVGGSAAGLDMSTKDIAYESLVNAKPPRVVPGDPAASSLFVRTNPALCKDKDDCTLMPRGQAPLSGVERSLIERWIKAGAKKD